jgi:AcrR family transcriptional regulator
MSQQEKRPDRRIERTQQSLSKALMELIAERDYHSITIQEIADRANVARATFYVRYPGGKDDLLFQTLASMYGELMNPPLEPDAEADERPLVTDRLNDPRDFEHVARYADFYRSVLSNRGSAAFIVAIREFLASALREEVLDPRLPTGSEPRLPLDVVASFLAGAEMGLIHWWLENDMPYSAEQMAVMMNRLCSFGLMWALDLDAAPPHNEVLTPAPNPSIT